MIEDHLGVVDETGAAAERAHSRLGELLDREILPCLERPGRQLGPFDFPLRANTGISNVALIWPSVAEGVQAPAAVRPLFEFVASLRALQPSLACAPAADLEQALADRRLPLFGRPHWTPLSAHSLWIAVLVEPLDLFGLLTVMRAARVPLRAMERQGAPTILLTGAGAERAGDLALVFGDAVVAWDTLTSDDGAWFARLDAAWPHTESNENSLPEGVLGAIRRAGLGAHGRAGAIAAPAARAAKANSIVRDALPQPLQQRSHMPPGQRREENAALLVRGTDQLNRRLRRRQAGRSTAFTDYLWVGSASARLREKFAMVDGVTLARELDETFAAEAGAVALDFVWGLPGETGADRAALAPLLDAIVAAAPRGVRQVRARLGWFVPSAAEHAAGMSPISSAAAAESLDRLRSDLGHRRLRIDTSPASRAAVATLLEAARPDLAPVLEAVHAAGARTSEDQAACDPVLWRTALADCGLAELWTEVESEPTADAPQAHGFASEAPRSNPDTHAVATDVGLVPRADRWTRWQALVPRQFDVRIEFGKLDRLRLLGPGELTEVFLGALERAQIPLATSGVVEPKPKISFGPSLPVGIAGEREVVDLGLAQPVPALLERLRSELPAGIELRAAVDLPPHAPQLALGQVALAEYAVDIRPDQFIDPQARATSVESLQTWCRRIEAGQPCVDESDDVLHQLRDLRLGLSNDGILSVRFTLDLRDSGPKCRPREVLSRGLSGLSVDVRCLPLRRLRLLVLAEEPARVVPTTPFDLVLRESRQQRARAKFSA